MSVEQLPNSMQTALDIQHLIHNTGDSPHTDLLVEFVETVLRARDLQRVDLKILLRTVRELRYAFTVFARYRHIRKVTVFGSARTKPEKPIYDIARTFSRRMTEAGFMVITGAGDGIMRAGQEGAGRDHSFGLNILLPFEQEANDIILDDPKLVYLKYFFTRKLMFVKETNAFALFPGGFGTHDEAFEALTLMQTGKCNLMPIVFLEAPGSSYWRDWRDFVERNMLTQALISPSDMHLFKVTNDVDQAVDEIVSFYHNYHSSRYVDGQLVIRLQQRPTDTLVGRLNHEFADILTQGTMQVSEAIGYDAEEVPELPRLRLWFDRVNFGRLRQMIDIINQD